MSVAIGSLVLVAVRGASYRWGRFDHERPGFGATEFLLLLGMLAIVIFAASVAYSFAQRRKNEFWRNNPSRMFQELSRAHRLDLAERRLLKKLASARNIENPSLLFADPDLFETRSEPGLNTAGTDLRQLRQQLFD
jgi:hypothetical protein